METEGNGWLFVLCYSPYLIDFLLSIFSLNQVTLKNLKREIYITAFFSARKTSIWQTYNYHFNIPYLAISITQILLLHYEATFAQNRSP